MSSAFVRARASIGGAGSSEPRPRTSSHRVDARAADRTLQRARGCSYPRCGLHMDGTSNRADDPEVHADTLGELPAVVQRYLVFQAILTTLGFPPEAIDSVLVPARSDSTGGELVATVEVDGRGFSYVLGPTIPHVTSWLARAAELWRLAAPVEREALYLTSPLFERTAFPELLRAITHAGLTPPIPIGLWYSRLESSGIGEAVRRKATFPTASPPLSRAPERRRARQRCRRCRRIPSDRRGSRSASRPTRTPTEPNCRRPSWSRCSGATPRATGASPCTATTTTLHSRRGAR